MIRKTGMIQVYKNFLPNDLIKDIFSYVKDNMKKNTWYTNISWQDVLVNKSNQVSMLLLSPFVEDIKRCYVQKNDIYGDYNFIAQFYVWQRGSHITWHYDNDHSFGSTIYLNSKWNRNDGGLYMYEEEGQIKAEEPEYNKMILNDNKLYHSVSMITNTAENVRTTIQVWGDERK